MIRKDCEVAVVGAGPYGLSVGAHLNAAGVSARVFGDPMSFWQRQMPRGMKLRSPWIASHLADPAGSFSLDAYAAAHGLTPHYPLPLEHFIDYGKWFQRSAVPNLDTRKVARLEQHDGAFRLELDDGEEVGARRVVIALGLARQELRPEPFAGLPSALVSHSCEHDSLDGWSGKRVAVIGRGQSACESAALLNETGTAVDLICRGDVRWLGMPPQAQKSERSGLKRLRARLAAPSEVGPFPLDWLNELPTIAHLLPAGLREWITVRSLRPASAGWVRPRFDGVRISAGSAVTGARALDHEVVVDLEGGARVYDHVLLATGYRIDIAKLPIWAPELLHKIEHISGSPRLGTAFESSVAGLHFVGSSAVASYGPLMRFVAGAGYAASSIARHVAPRRRLPVTGNTKPIAGAAYGGSAGTLSRP